MGEEDGGVGEGRGWDLRVGKILTESSGSDERGSEAGRRR